MTQSTLATQTVLWDVAHGAAARGTLVLITGRGEHPGVYARLGRRISFDGYRVHIVDGADRQAAETEAADLLAAGEPGKPRVLAGSDTGAVMALQLASRAGPDAIADAVVLAALPLDGASDTRPDDEVRSACPLHRQVLASEENLDPGAFASRVDPSTLPEPRDLGVPVLAFHGQADMVVPLDTARTWMARVPQGQLSVTAGGLHDAFNDKQHRSVAARIVLFLEELGHAAPVLIDA